MQDFKSHVKRVERRVNHLRKKAHTNSYDKAELGGLQALLRVSQVYEDARGPGGSHVENALFMVRDVVTEINEEWADTLDEDALGRLASAERKCTEAIDLIHRIRVSDES